MTEYDVFWNYGHNWQQLGHRTVKQLELEINRSILGEVHSLWKATPIFWIVVNRRNGNATRFYRLLELR